MIAIILSLFELTRRARSILLKRKYVILLLSFISFQAIGIPLSNYLLISYQNFPPLGGVLNLLTFLFIGLALTLKEEKIFLTPTTTTKDFEEVYSSFLAILYNQTASTSLGEESFKFVDFVRESGTEDCIQVSRMGVIFKSIKNLNIIDLINKNLKILEASFKDTEVVDYYLRVLNVAYGILGDNFFSIIEANEDFLKKSDLIYGIGRGRYIERITEDRSLDNLDVVDACLKIYKRILLLVSDEIRTSVEFKKKLTMYYATKDLKITEYGEVLMRDTSRIITKVPKEERPSILIESFNSFTGWVYEKIFNDSNVNAQNILEKLHIVLTLNKKKADELNIYHTFLESLVARIPKTQIHRLYSDYLEELVETRTVELKEVQKRLLESERMAAIGETAAMVGHDLRNPLQVIFNALYLVKSKLDSSSTLSNQKETLEQIIGIISEQAQYMNKIVSDLQDYARPIAPETVEVDLGKLVNEVFSTLIISQNVKTKIEIQDDSPKVPVDPMLMKRVFSNLFTNAVQAMPNGGQLTVSIHKKGDNAIIDVIDTGSGILKENLSKLFNPLFTTKAKGQGLGLAVCKRLVDAHGGVINVESEVNKGSKFTVTLPLTVKTVKNNI
jgi:signal transduction histidine kinase